MMDIVEIGPDLIRGEAAAMMGGVSLRHFNRLVSLGLAPRPLRLGAAVVFRESEIAAWIASYRKWARRNKKRAHMARAPRN